MTTILFRRAGAADWKAVSGFSQELGRFQKQERPVFEPAELISITDRDRPLFYTIVAEKQTKQTNDQKEEQKVIGACSYFLTYAPYCVRSLYANGLYVTPQERRRGIARGLFNWNANFIRSLKCKEGHGWVKKWNKPSLSLMYKMGGFDSTTELGHHEQVLSTYQTESLPNPKLPYTSVRLATKDDCKQIANLMKDSANHKISPKTDHVTEQQLQEDGFGDLPFFQALVVEDTRLKEKGAEDYIVGCSIFTEAFGFFYGRLLHLAGLYVQPEYEKDQLDMKIWRSLAQISKANECRGLFFTTCDRNNSYKYACGLDAEDYVTNQEIHSVKIPFNKI